MLRHTLAVVALLSLTASACTSNLVTNANASHANPDWLIGSLDGGSYEGSSAVGSTWINLRADGIAEDGASSFNPDIPYSDPHQVSYEYKWWVDGSTLHIDNRAYAMSVAANCHLVQLVDTSSGESKTYSLNSNHDIPSCPYPEAPLTDGEQALLGDWTSSYTDDTIVFLFIDANRLVDFSSGSNRSFFRFELDADGKTIYAMSPDGSYLPTPRLTLNAGHIRSCDDDGCVILNPYTP